MIDLGPGAVQVLIAIVAVFGLYLKSIKNGQTAEQIQAQMKPNGGSSLRDAIDRIEASVQGLEGRLSNVEKHPTQSSYLTGYGPQIDKESTND